MTKGIRFLFFVFVFSHYFLVGREVDDMCTMVEFTLSCSVCVALLSWIERS